MVHFMLHKKSLQAFDKQKELEDAVDRSFLLEELKKALIAGNYNAVPAPLKQGS